MKGFPAAARTALADPQMRRNVGHATAAIQGRRAAAVGEVADWEQLREAGAAVKRAGLAALPELLTQLEERVTAAGGTVHWARDGAEANAIVAGLAAAKGNERVIKAKSMACEEIGLNAHLEREGVEVVETDLAELVVQLFEDRPSHLLVPAIHRNQHEIRDLFARTIAAPDLADDPTALVAAARAHLREAFLSTRMAITGANFAVAETGSVCIVESEGNARFCVTMPETLVTVMGIEKVVADWEGLGVMLQLLPRSATGERMNPYTSVWTGADAGDGPREFHLVLLDNGRTDVLADEVGREALHCIRCSACLNVCPVFRRTGGHAYDSVYGGPIGAVLTPLLSGMERGATLPSASTLCGACYEVCPVKIDIPSLLVHTRGRARREGKAAPWSERAAMGLAARTFADRGRYERAQRLLRLGRGPLAKLGFAARPWTAARELPDIPEQNFRNWWRSRPSDAEEEER